MPSWSFTASAERDGRACRAVLTATRQAPACCQQKTDSH